MSSRRESSQMRKSAAEESAPEKSSMGSHSETVAAAKSTRGSAGRRKFSVGPFLYALVTCNMNLLPRMLEQGADVNHVFQGSKRLSPLFIAVENDSISVINLLLKHGCDVDNEAQGGETVLFHAIRKKNLKLVELLIEAGCNIDHVAANNKRPIFLAVETGRKDIVELLVKHNVDLNCCDKKGERLLLRALDKYAVSCKSGVLRARTTRQRYPGDMRDIVLLLIPLASVNAWQIKDARRAELVFGDLLQVHNPTVFSDILKHNCICHADSTWTTVMDFVTMGSLCDKVPRNIVLEDYFSLVAQTTPYDKLKSCELIYSQEVMDVAGEFFSQPLDLETMCCQKIRWRLCEDGRLWQKIDMLPLPSLLKDRLKLKNYSL